MKSNRVLMVFGTRPETIKMAPVHEVSRATGEFDVRVCETAQQGYMLDWIGKHVPDTRGMWQ